MELTRRDAVAALAALGAGGAVAVGASRYRDAGTAPEDDPDDGEGAGDPDAASVDGRVTETYVAVAAVVYPSEVSGIGEFVRAFLPARLERDGHGTAMREVGTELDELAREWHGAPVAELAPGTRERLLREVGADTAEERPGGTLAERVRYYVVNELLLALYSSPTGGKLVGIENPQGHPGGTDSYQQGPDAVSMQDVQ